MLKKWMLLMLAIVAVATLPLVAGCGGGLSTSEKEYLTKITEQASQFGTLRADTLAFVQGAVDRAPDGPAFVAWLKQWQPLSDRYSRQLAALQALTVPPRFQAIHQGLTTAVTTYSGTLEAINKVIADKGSPTPSGASITLGQQFLNADDLFEQVQATLRELYG